MNMKNEKSNENNEKIECVLNEKDFNLYGETRSVVVDEKCDYNLVKRNTKKETAIHPLIGQTILGQNFTPGVFFILR